MDFVIDSKKRETKQILYDCLRNLDGEYIVKIKKRVKGRSLKVNAYYWGVVIGTVSDYTGHDPTYLHEYFKYKFIPAVKFTDVSRLTTSDMTHEEIWAYINLIRVDVKSVLNLDIADPDGVIL
jgi:hypothetical protein